MSKVVPLPQVWTVAVPETVGVHWNTFSGEPLVTPQPPASVLVPLVAPVKVPPCDGMTVGLLQLPLLAMVVEVVVVVVVVVVLAAHTGVEALAGMLVADWLPALSSAATA